MAFKVGVGKSNFEAISFKDVAGESFHDAFDMLKYSISDACKENADIIADDRLNEDDIEIFNHLMSTTAASSEVKRRVCTATHRSYAME